MKATLIRRSIAMTAFTVAALLSVSTAGNAATPGGSPFDTEIAADAPFIDPRSNGETIYDTYPVSPEGAFQARYHVHSAACANRFCTIQRYGNSYIVFAMWGCDIFDLHNFYGLWDAHNHTRSSVHFRGRNDEFLARYASGRDDNVNWTPVHAVATCSG